MAEHDPEPSRRTLQAPQPDDTAGTSPVISVEVGADEEVEWVWTHLPGGASVVTGYEIRKRRPDVD